MGINMSAHVVKYFLYQHQHFLMSMTCKLHVDDSPNSTCRPISKLTKVNRKKKSPHSDCSIFLVLPEHLTGTCCCFYFLLFLFLFFYFNFALFLSFIYKYLWLLSAYLWPFTSLCIGHSYWPNWRIHVKDGSRITSNWACAEQSVISLKMRHIS